jgi:hypothetical protein
MSGGHGFMKHLFRYVFRRHHDARYDKGEHYGAHRPYQHHGHGYPDGISTILPFIARSLTSAKKLLWILAALTFLVILAMIGLIVALIPLFTQFIDYLAENGLRGAVDILIRLFQRVWEGSGK